MFPINDYDIIPIEKAFREYHQYSKNEIEKIRKEKEYNERQDPRENDSTHMDNSENKRFVKFNFLYKRVFFVKKIRRAVFKISSIFGI